MNHPIVGIGELLWDIYPDGRKVAGGAPFNFAFHCRQLGHEAVIVSRVGGDALGRELREEVKRLGLSDDFIQTDRDHPTGTVTVALDESKVPTYTINDNVAWDWIEWSNELEILANKSGAICFGTLAQRSDTSADSIDRFLSRGRLSLRVFDINHRQTSRVRPWLTLHSNRADWIKVNEDEYRVISNPQALTKKHKYWMSFKPDKKVVLITRGAEGCEWFTDYPCGEHYLESAVPANVVDTVGAGDAFTAAMVCLHLEGKSLRDCARFANHYAARVCEHQGATPRIDRADVERSL